SPRTSSKGERTSARSRSCSATRAWPRPSGTRTCRGPGCSPPTGRVTRRHAGGQGEREREGGSPREGGEAREARAGGEVVRIAQGRTRHQGRLTPQAVGQGGRAVPNGPPGAGQATDGRAHGAVGRVQGDRVAPGPRAAYPALRAAREVRGQPGRHGPSGERRAGRPRLVRDVRADRRARAVRAGPGERVRHG